MSILNTMVGLRYSLIASMALAAHALRIVPLSTLLQQKTTFKFCMIHFFIMILYNNKFMNRKIWRK